MQIKPDILEYLDKHDVSYECATRSGDILSHVDVVYQTRIDRARLAQRDIDLTPYNIDQAVLGRMRQDALIMHPLPRSVEIDHAVDSDPRAAYFRQTQNGLYVRMALLTMLLDYE
jgi:aspartate carbamoyltransferase catalytic subunit